MNYTQEQVNEVLTTVEALMKRTNIPFRDTWNGVIGENIDDAIQNNGQSGGPRLLTISSQPSGKAEIKDYHIYYPTQFKSAAYDSFKIYIPDRLLNKKDVVVHELVHFLQENNEQLEKQYIGYDGNNYETYVGQRCELEAHFIQLLYIMENTRAVTNPEERIDFRIRLQEAIYNPQLRLALILEAKDKGIL